MSSRQRHRRDAGKIADALMVLAVLTAALVAVLGAVVVFVAGVAAAGLLKLAEILTINGG